MTQDQRRAPDRGTSSSTRLPSRQGRIAEDERAELRREALRRFMKRNGLSPASLSRAIGIARPNTIYNFLRGNSRSLSLSVLERIVEAFPNAPRDGLLGHCSEAATSPAAAEPPAGYRWVQISAIAQAGVWRDSAEKADSSDGILMPDDVAPSALSLIGVRVKAPCAELVFPAGSILVCTVVPRQKDASVPDDSIVVIARTNDTGRTEVTVREVSTDEGETWLWPLSTSPHHQQPLPAPWQTTATASAGDGRIAILGVVVAAWQARPPPNF